MTPSPFSPAALEQVASAVARLGTSAIEPVGSVLAGIAGTIAELRAPRRPPPGEPYWRSHLYRTDALEIVLMCFGGARDWLPHDHGGSAGWVYVLDGRGEHVLFGFADDGALRERRRERLSAGDLIFMPHDTIHTLGPAGDRLSTIFAYAPPISGMGVYDPRAGRGCIVSDDCGAWWPTLPAQLVREFDFTPHDHRRSPFAHDEDTALKPVDRQKSSQLERIETLLYHPDIDGQLGEPRFRHLRDEIGEAVRRCFEADSAPDRQLVHEILYAINVASLALPWERTAIQANHPFIAEIRRTIETAWDRDERERHRAVLDAAPPVAQFEQWVTEHVRDHRANVSHPLFGFLQDEATLDQLRSFFFQETPFDIFHADLITMMMPGVYGVMKEELAKNFWDEMGGGHAAAMHRTIRIDTARSLGLDTDAHVRESQRFCAEELALANMYFDAVANRGKLLQAIGMMLATETMVPGRINRQIEGFRRNGLDGDQISYLTMHAEVDIEHGAGWMRNVVLPLLERHPAAMREMLLGVERRLYQAGAVCDRMLTYLPESAPATAGAA